MAANLDKKERLPWPPQRLLLLAVVLCVAGGFYVLETRRPPTAMQVQATRDMAAHTIVAANAITLAQGVAVPGALANLPAAAGRLALADIKPGAVITRGMLLAAPAPPPDWLIVRLPLSGTLSLAAGEMVILYGTKGDGSAASELAGQVLVVAADTDSLTVAAPPETVPVALGYLAGGRLFAVRRIR